MDESTKDKDDKVKFPTYKTLWRHQELNNLANDLIRQTLGTSQASFSCRQYSYVTLGGVRRGIEGGKYTNASYFATKENPPRIGQFMKFWELMDNSTYVAFVKFYEYETNPINRLPTIDLLSYYYEVIRFPLVGEVVVAAPPLEKDKSRYLTILGNVFYY